MRERNGERVGDNETDLERGDGRGETGRIELIM